MAEIELTSRDLEIQTAFSRGMMTRLDGYEKINPYPDDEQLHIAWHEGWTQGGDE